MRSFGLSLISLFFSYTSAASAGPSLECAGRDGDLSEECRQPAKPITTVTPGSFYVANVPCLDCPVLQYTGNGDKDTVRWGEDNDLFFNISLSRNTRTLLLNDKPIFPSLSTNPRPPRIYTSQVSPNLTRADLDHAIACIHETCRSGCGCFDPDNLYFSLDFDYYSHWLESHPETQTEKWEIAFDAIGGHYLSSEFGWQFNNSAQYMLRIIVQGREIEGERYAGEKDMQAASSLFGGLEESEALYEYEIVSIDLMQRSYTFPPQQKLGILGRFRRFFGLDIVRKDGHIVYIQNEWGAYGKKGSLRNTLGPIIHDWPWDLIFIILGSVAGGLLGLWLSCKLFVLVKQQRELARWDGMDAVWANMRREEVHEEEDRLLYGGYRDEPDEGRPPLYADEVDTNKPLPSKPLPEKPLPAVPLIDA